MESKKTIYQKLLQVQLEMEPVTKGKDNPFYKSKYADINEYIDVVKPILLKNGLLPFQPLTKLEDGTPAIKTMIVDAETGDVLEDTTPILTKETDPQKFGSAVTYYRRYALQSFLFLQAEDDDGNKASAKAEVKVVPVKTNKTVFETTMLKVGTLKTVEEMKDAIVKVDESVKLTSVEKEQVKEKIRDKIEAIEASQAII